MPKFIYYIILLLLCSQVTYLHATELTIAWEIENLDAPESVLYDMQHKILFVSNVNGSPLEKNKKGYISVISLQGEIKKKHWVENLNAPKGISRYGDLLYVADLDTLIEINIDNGKIENRYYSNSAKFLNDVVVDKNAVVYVSDMFTNKIFQLNNKVFEVWLHNNELEYPNGLYIENEHLIVGSWGNITQGFTTDVLGHLKSVSLIDKTVTSLGNAQPVGNLDGVEADGHGNFFVTDWMNGGLFLISKNGDAEKILELPQGSADLEVIPDKNLIIIPKMLENKLTAYYIN